MTQYLFLGAILLLRVMQSISSKGSSNEMPRNSRGISAYMSVRMGMSAVFALLLLLFSGNALASVSKLPPLGWLIACGTGLTLTVSCICSLLAMHGSSVVLGSVFSMAGLLVPTLFGIFLFDQSVSLIQWGGIFCLFVAAALLASSSQTTNGKLTVKTVALLFGSMLANGTTMLLQTMYKKYVPAGDVTLYSFLQFAIPSVAMLLVFGLKSSKKEKKEVKFSKKLILFTILAAIAIFGISQISTVASATIPSAVLFPVSDGGAVVISAIVAATVYKEKITYKSAVGICIGILGLCVINLAGTIVA